jgi:hypothetical protein
MPSVVLLTQDLMFGSKVEGMIREAHAEVVLTGDPSTAADTAASASLLVVDLTSDAFDGTTIIAADPVPTLGFYAHTDDETRQKALAAGFKLVVPRSRMMREGVSLISELIAR